MTMTLALVAVAMAASLFVTTSTAEAKPAERQLKAQVEERFDPALDLTAKTRGDRDLKGPSNWLCPAGTVAVAFDHPIYENEGDWFPIGYETVWYCIDISGGPAG